MRSFVLVLGAVAAWWALAGKSQQPPPGQDLFQRRCTGCHALDRDKEGPRLGGVFGRAAGKVPSFEYSAALKSSGIVWNAETLEKWLEDPGKMVPENDMPFRLESAAEREAIIEYLKKN